MTIPAYIKASIIFIGIFVFTSILSITQEIIVPIIYATIIAIVLRPMVDFLCRRGFNRTIAITTTIVSACSGYTYL
jgi:predicted PurR-regulated permease PerM